MKLRERTYCLNCEHLTQRIATLEDKLLQAMERIAKVEEEIHRREEMTAAGFQKALEAAREQVMKAATTRVPDTKRARNLAKRFRENGDGTANAGTTTSRTASTGGMRSSP